MEALAQHGASTAADLHRACNLPKSTIRRILKTLCQRRLVRRSLADQKYRLAITLPQSREESLPKETALFGDIAMPILAGLTSRIGWPCDIQIVDSTAVRLIDSTRAQSPFYLYSGVVDWRFNIFASASGKACLSVMPQSGVEDIIRRTDGDRQFGLGRFGMTADALFGTLEQVRQKGFAVRQPGYLGETVADDGLTAIAVPIQARGHPVGATALHCPRLLMCGEELAEKHLADLTAAAAEIVRELESLRGARAPSQALPY